MKLTQKDVAAYAVGILGIGVLYGAVALASGPDVPAHAVGPVRPVATATAGYMGTGYPACTAEDGSPTGCIWDCQTMGSHRCDAPSELLLVFSDGRSYYVQAPAHP